MSEFLLRPNVVHCKKDRYDVFIARPTLWGNLWGLEGSSAEFIVQTHAECVLNHKLWLLGLGFNSVHQDRRVLILRNLYRLSDKILGCWCKPKSCHGDIYVHLCNNPKKVQVLLDVDKFLVQEPSLFLP